ncbi:MAG: nucleoside triphosphate pyrophosphohydrolase [Candidatus Paceibacterota bacterium]
MTEVYNKLVRDLIPDIIAADGKEASVRILEEDEYKIALLSKLIEEAEEVVEASGDSKELTKEIGDLEEVISSLIQACDLSREDITKLRQERKEDRGGFAKRIFLESVE